MKMEYLVEGPIGSDIITELLSSLADNKSTGGHSLFLGQVREDLVNNKKVKAIEYSAYDALIARETENIISLTKNAFNDVQNIIIMHSTGLVPTGGISLLVIVSAGHRDQASRACRHVVEMIKKDYPVWKKEILEDNSHQWRENEF